MRARTLTLQTGTAEELAPLERSSLTQRVAELIRQAIVNGVLPPGEPISLREVAARLGVSATPVREALFQLSAAGLVQFLPGRVRIASPSPAALADSFVLREALEGMAARLAAGRRSDAEAREIGGLAKQSFEAVEKKDGECFRAVDVEFHRAIARAARSKQLERYTLNALDLALTLRNLRTLGRNIRPSYAHLHLSIAAAIERREADEAERLSREHVRNVFELITADGNPTPRQHEM